MLERAGRAEVQHEVSNEPRWIDVWFSRRTSSRSRNRYKLEAVCDKALAETIGVLQPKHIVGVGMYAAKRAALVTGSDAIITMPHPSPVSPAANKGWEKAARKALVEAGLPDFL